jgi:hypothetical protein
VLFEEYQRRFKVSNAGRTMTATTKYAAAFMLLLVALGTVSTIVKKLNLLLKLFYVIDMSLRLILT